MPKVSVIMGVYNVETTLARALDSILGQTFQDFEIILCDDGSMDRTYEIAAAYRDREPERITLLRNEENKKLHYTLNRCLEHARGEYIARMDGDDWCAPNRFEKQVAFLDSHPEIGFVSSSMQLCDENGAFRTTKVIEYPSSADVATGHYFCHPASMIRAEAYRTVGGYTVSNRTTRVEDLDLWIKLYKAGYRGYNDPEPMNFQTDNLQAVARRKYRYRVSAFLVQMRGCYLLHGPWYGYVLPFRHLLVGLLPRPVYLFLHR